MSSTAQLSARERVNALLDNNSFVEIGAFVTKRNTDFNLDQMEIPSDGVITGYGIIDGNPVYIYSQDATLLGGSIGEMHAKKITHVYELALKTGTPVIGLLDSSGLRLQEATDALNAFGEIYLHQTRASGIIPQITAVFGNCGGGLAVMASLSDFSFMEENNAKLFVNSPNSLHGNYREKLNSSEAGFHAEAGTIDYAGKDEGEVIMKIRELVSLLPSNNEAVSITDCTDDLNRMLPGIENKIGDTKNALIDISDGNYFFELKKDYAKDIVTGFIRLNGMTIGAIANRTEILDEQAKILEKLEGTLSADGCSKAAGFVNFCDAFNIPVLTLTNVSGYKAEVAEERKIAKAAAGLTYAFANSSIPKVNVIIGKAYGSAYIAMNSKHIGADIVFAFPGAKIGMMEAELAAQIMYDKEPAEVIKEKRTEYEKLQTDAFSAAKRGYVDNIIEPASVRKHLIYAFEMLFTKSETLPAKKHGSK